MNTLSSAAGQFLSRHRQVIWVASLVSSTLLYLILSAIYPQGLLEAGPSDHFYDLIQDVVAKEEHDLRFVHTLRFYVVYPLYILDIHNLNFGESIIILIISLPIILFFRKEFGGFLVHLIIFSVFFISMRAYICACGFAYLYMVLRSDHSHNKVLFLFSLIFSILSSGVLFVWTIVAATFYRSLRKQIGLAYFFGVAAAVMILSTSIMHKAVYFNDLAAAPAEESDAGIGEKESRIVQLAKYGPTYVLTVISRNSFVRSIENKNYVKSAKYLVFILILLVSTIHAVGSRDSISLFFLPGLVAVLVEGLAFPSYYIAASLYAMTHVLPRILPAGSPDSEGFGQDRRVGGLDQPPRGQLRS